MSETLGELQERRARGPRSMLMLFDLDDTLVHRRAVFSSWAEEFASQYPEQSGLAAWLTAEDQDGLRPREELWSRVKTRLSLDLPVERLVSDWQEVFVARYAVDPDTLDALRRARSQRWRLGVVTNGDAAVQAAKIAAAGLAPLVDGICISGAEGVAKPHREIFDLAALRCGADLVGGWMIGDSPLADIQGAHNAGLNSVWIADEGIAWPPEHRPPTRSAATVSAAVDLILSLPTQEPVRRS
ncbi:MAG: HAD family hydrolase [Propionibacteriales bacterium]|nr:HAD family hydrolase [Propionibacteriales bacterium]